MSKNKSLNIGIVCGEHSGDRLGAGLIKEIKKDSEINLYGIGGPKLEELGFKSEFDFSDSKTNEFFEELSPSPFGSDGNPYVRLVFCLKDDTLNQMIERII